MNLFEGIHNIIHKENQRWASKLGAENRKNNCTGKPTRNVCAKLSNEAIEDFASNTTIHGVKYAFEPRRRFIERCIWIASVSICVTAAAILVQISVQKFYTNPTLTSIMESFCNQTRKLPFPAITFCNVNLIFRYKVEMFLDKLVIPVNMKMTRERLAQVLPSVAVLIRPTLLIDPDILHDLQLVQQILEANNIPTPMAVKSLGQPCHDMVERCSWNGVLSNCSYFQRKATFNGYCCSFNYDDPDTTWPFHPDKNPYKLRSPLYGPGNGLRVLLNPMQSEYMMGSYVSSGLIVAIHRSDILPEGPWTFINPNSETLIRIAMDFTDSDMMLKAVNPERRRCRFYDESNLKISNRYSRDACVLECRLEFVVGRCNCIPFYHLKKGSNTFTLFDNTDEIESENTVLKCHCLAQCTVLAYKVGMTRSNFEAVEHFVGDFYSGMNTSGRASVNIYLASQVGQITKVDIIYTVEQLMSKLGGICSLLLGCSFLTAMEVVYYAILRYSAVLCARSPKSTATSLNTGSKPSSQDLQGSTTSVLSVMTLNLLCETKM